MVRLSRPAISIHTDDDLDQLLQDNDTFDQDPYKPEANAHPENHDPPNFYRTSLSSLPQSSFASEDESQLCTPTKKRFHTSNPSPTRSRYSATLTPRTVRTARMRTSPRPRTRERQEEQDRTALPLVLLHITLLPVALPWSAQIMKKVLPQEVLDRLNLLRDRVCSAVLQRGVLIPHPEEDIEVLEERLIEALGLDSNAGSDEQSEGEDAGDSGFGSVDGDEVEGKTARSEEWERAQKWEVKVFAANGLMRASTWASAWSEMERVDVEVVPFIPEDLRRQLDALRDEDDAYHRIQEEQQRLEDLQRREAALDRAVQIHEKKDAELERRIDLEERLRNLKAISSQTATTEGSLHARTKKDRKVTSKMEDHLPPAYRPKEIPLDVLMRNYFYLLAQDKRNMIMAFLAVIVVFLSFKSLGSYRVSPSGEIQICKAMNDSVVPQVLMLQNQVPNRTEDLGYMVSELPAVANDYGRYNKTDSRRDSGKAMDTEEEASELLEAYIGQSDTEILED